MILKQLFSFIERVNEVVLSNFSEYDIAVLKQNLKSIASTKYMKNLKSVLKDREKLVIELRYGLYGGEEVTQQEIAKMLGISRSYVSRIEKKAFITISVCSYGVLQ